MESEQTVTQSIESRVIACVKDYLSEDESAGVKPEAYFCDLAVDSIEKLDIIQRVETELKVRIPNDHLEGILSVQHLIDEVNNLRAYRPLAQE